MTYSRHNEQESRDKLDQELLNDYSKNSDPDILGDLYTAYMHLVYGVCLKYLKEREKAKDAVMQIFEKLIKEVPRHNIQNFRSWLYVLTKNHCLMEVRSTSSRLLREKKYSREQEIFMESGPGLHPIDEEKADLNRALQECIESLRNQQKECIQLFYFEDKSYREISNILNIEENKVKSYLQNAKRNLKICLENKNVDQE